MQEVPVTHELIVSEPQKGGIRRLTEQAQETDTVPKRRRVFSEEQAESLARAYLYLLELAAEQERRLAVDPVEQE
jgi:hypothetical protein